MEQVGTLEIDQDLDHERRAWKWRRAGWTGITLVLAAAVAGLFGPPGVFSRATAGEPGSELWVEYPRFLRMSRPAELRIHFQANDPTVRLWLDDQLLDSLDVDHMTPQPSGAVAASGRTVFEISASPTTSRPAVVVLAIEAVGAGVVDGRVGLVGGPEVRLRQLIYP